MDALDVLSRLRSFLPAELRRAGRCLQRTGHKALGKSVHDARKSIKQLRAVLRLAHEMTTKAALNRVALPLRKATHHLGPLRENLVLRKTARSLRKRGEPLPDTPEIPDAVLPLRRARAQLREAERALAPFLASGLDFRGVQPGLRRLYKRAHRAMKQAAKSRSDADLHAWRRRAKDLYYSLELMEAPHDCRENVRQLTEFLGNDHDLASFLQDASMTRNETDQALLKRAKKQRRPLQKKAFRIGRRLLRHRPRAFVHRVLD